MVILTAKQAREIGCNGWNKVDILLNKISNGIRILAEIGNTEYKISIPADKVSLDAISALREYGYDVRVIVHDGLFFCIISW